MDDPATAAIRKKRNSSIRIAANCVRDGRAAGPRLGGPHRAPRWSRPRWSSARSRAWTGRRSRRSCPTSPATACCSTSAPTRTPKTPHFKEFAVMGSIYAELVFGKKNPSIGLMSIGEEDSKGTDEHEGSLQDAEGDGPELHRQRRGPRRLQRQGGRDRDRRLHGQRHPEGLRGAGRDDREAAPRGDQEDAAGLGRLPAVALGLPQLQVAHRLLRVRRRAASRRQGLRHHLPRPLEAKAVKNAIRLAAEFSRQGLAEKIQASIAELHAREARLAKA